MILIPAIDVRGGRAVRLRQGRFDEETVYAASPARAAAAWVEQGARRLHVVDLDGAREGAPRALGQLAEVVAAVGVPVQYGGGLRGIGAVEAAIAAGADQVVLGTGALRDRAFLEAALERFGDRLAVAVDARGGQAAVAGWAETTSVRADELAERLIGQGVRRIIYTDVDRDGMLEGPDADAVAAIADASGEAELVYSGGIGSLEHLGALAGLPLAGVICGKALYERRFTVGEGQAALDGARIGRPA